jgi:uncharacterized LabA/DUF88 family protein
MHTIPDPEQPKIVIVKWRIRDATNRTAHPSAEILDVEGLAPLQGPMQNPADGRVMASNASLKNTPILLESLFRVGAKRNLGTGLFPRLFGRVVCPALLLAFTGRRTLKKIMKSRENKLAVLIDGANLALAAREAGFEIDFKLLLREFQQRGALVRALYYWKIDEGQHSIRALLDWLEYNGYTVVTKATKSFVDAKGHAKSKGNITVELAVAAMELAEHVEQIVLFSGDGTLRPVVEWLQKRGVRVTVISTVAMADNELRRQADIFTDLSNLVSVIGRS